jgi:hypothetical protein
MLTWRLWQSLNHAKIFHPLFRRAVFALFTWPLGVLFFATPIGATWFGAVLAFRAAGVIAQQREQGVLDTLSVTTSGGLKTAWSFVAVCHQFREEIYQFYTVMYWLIAIPFGGLCCAALALSSFTTRNAGTLVLILTVYLGGVLLALYTDRLQSMALGAVVGMLGAIHENGRAGAQMWALGVFLCVQLILYAFTLTVILIGVNTGLWWLPPAGIALFLAAREGALRILWDQLLDRFNTDESEAAMILSQSAA